MPTLTDWKVIEAGFQNRWQYPNCIGVADGKHIQIQAPSKSGSTYYNYKVCKHKQPKKSGIWKEVYITT